MSDRPDIDEQLHAVQALGKHSSDNRQSLAIETAIQSLLYLQKYGPLFRAAIEVQRTNPELLRGMITLLQTWEGAILTVRAYDGPDGEAPEDDA